MNPVETKPSLLPAGFKVVPPGMPPRPLLLKAASRRVRRAELRARTRHSWCSVRAPSINGGLHSMMIGYQERRNKEEAQR
jgi:hypothetical protein